MKTSDSKKSVILGRLLKPIVAMIIILALLIVGMMGIMFYTTYESRVLADSEAETALIAESVSSFVSEAYALSEELANDPDILTMKTEIQNPVLKACTERNSYLELLYIQDVTGMQTGRSSGALADRSERWWFKQTVADKVPFVSKSYYSVNTGSPCASIFFPMYRDGAFVGVFAADLKLGSLVDKVKEYSDESADKTVFIIDGEGTIVAHPDASYIAELYNYVTYTKTVSVKNADGSAKKDANGNVLEEKQSFQVSDSFEKMIAAVMKGTKGHSLVTVDGGKYYAAYSPVIMDGQSDSWSVVTVQRRANLMRPLYLVLLMTVLISAFVVVLVILLVRKAVRKITDPLTRLTEMIGIASEGDFSVKAQGADESTEIGALAGSFNHMTEKVARVLGETMRLLADVKGSSVRLTELSSESDGMAKDIDRIASGAADQSADTERVVKLTDELRDCMEKLQKMSAQLKKQADETKELSIEGLENVSVLKDKSQNSLTAVAASYDKVLKLNESSQKIGTIIEEINSISSQTSLLALNASIEAARAGEAGRGFAVVASEVSSLAANSAKATESIDGIVTSLQKDISEIVALINSIKDSFEEQLSSVGQVETSFERFQTSSGQSLAMFGEVGTLIDTAGNVNSQVVSAINNIHEISRRTENDARDTAEHVANQTEDISMIARKVENMNAVSDLLEEEMSKFKL